MFSLAVSPNMTVSCGTTPIRARTSSGLARAMSTPSTRIRPPCGIVEPQQQLERGALAGAGRADERDPFARPDVEGEAVQSALRRAATGS